MTAPLKNFEFDLFGNIAVVTGAGSGIGAAIAKAFATKGAMVVCLDLNRDAAAMVATECQQAQAFNVDVASPTDVEDAVWAVIAAFGRIDILMNCAGVVYLAPAEDLTVAAW